MKLPKITIKRDEHEIELTEQEMSRIFYEMEHYYHKEDLESELTCRIEENCGTEKNLTKIKAILNDEETFNDLAEYYGEMIGDDESWHYILENAIERYLQTYGEEEN